MQYKPVFANKTHFLSASVFSNCVCDFTMPVEACACVGMHKAIPINIVVMMSFFFMLNPP